MRPAFRLCPCVFDVEEGKRAFLWLHNTSMGSVLSIFSMLLLFAIGWLESDLQMERVSARMACC